MKKIIAIFLVVLVLSPSTNAFAAVDGYSEKDLAQSIFQLTYEYTTCEPTEYENVMLENVWVSHGTIFAIDGGYFITAAHCLSGDGHYNELYYTEFTSKKKTVCGFYEVIYIDYKLDFAILKGDKVLQKRAKPLSFSDMIYATHSKVFTIGYPKDGGRICQTGEIIDSENKDFSQNWIATSIDAIEGQSGSPILDEVGNIIGVLILRWTIEKDGNIYVETYALNSDFVEDILKER